MDRSRKILMLGAGLCYTVMIAVIFFLVGYRAAYNRIGNSAASCRAQTFYAVISDIRDNALTVKGMEVNDINFRGDFHLSIGEETAVTWRYTDISMEDLDVGDHISITFTGPVLETYPGQITQVEAVQLLDDEK